MALTGQLIGLVSYTLTPTLFFRMVLPNYAQGDTDAILDDPYWVTFGCDTSRLPIMTKVDSSLINLKDLTGVP